MKPVREPNLGSQTVSGRDRRFEGCPRLARVVGDEDTIAIRVEPVVMVDEGEPERNAPEVIWQLAGGLPMITTVTAGNRHGV
jgi:hypothetical protein